MAEVPQVPELPPAVPGAHGGDVPVAIPPGQPPVAAGPPVTPLPAFLTPTAVHGDITRFLMALYGNDLARWKQMINTDMSNMNSMLSIPDGLNLSAYSTGVEEGPLSFLTIGPSLFNESIVEVIHCTRSYFIPPSQPNAMNDPTANKIILFVGDMSHGTLPKIWSEPTLGLPNYFQEQLTRVPTQVQIANFYAAHPPNQLMGRAPGAPDRSVRPVIYIPQMMTTAFIEGLPPKTALDRMMEMMLLFDLEERPKFDYILNWLRAACQKQGGGTHQAELSNLLVPYSGAGRTPYFREWAIRILDSYYRKFRSNALPPAAPLAGVNFESLGTAISQGISQSLVQASQTFTAAMPIQPQKTKEDWTDLQKGLILKMMGKPQGSDFEDEVPEIWSLFMTEGRTTADVKRVMDSQFLVDPTDPDVNPVKPYISRQVASDIKSCSFSPSYLSVDNCNQGLLPMAVSPRSATERNIDADDDAIEDRATSVSVEALEKRKAKSRKNQAPRNYQGMMDALYAIAVVWKVLFSRDCPLVRQLNAVRAEFSQQREYLQDVMSPRQVATVLWKITMHTMRYVLTPYNPEDGSAPAATMHLLIGEARTNTFSPVVSMPDAFIAKGNDIGFGRGWGAPAPGGEKTESTFGEPAGTSQPKPEYYNHVHPEVQEMLKEIKARDKFCKMETMVRNYKGNLRLTELLLKPGHCLDYMALGICRRGADKCRYDHNPAVRADDDAAKNFCKLVKPAVEEFLSARPPRKKQKNTT